MKKYFTIILLMGLLCSCKDKYEIDECESSFWSPLVKVEKGNEKATLYLIDPRPFAQYVCGPPDPSYFNIFISEDLQEFNLYQTVAITTESVTIENLVNDRPYYFLVTTHKENNPHIFKDTMMTVPSKETVLEPYININDYSLKRFSSSYDQNYVTFNVADNTVVDGLDRNTLYYKQKDTGTINKVEKDAFNENWSPNSNKLVYLTCIVEGITQYPYEIKLLDFETMASTALFEANYPEYNIFNPDFMPDGDVITYLSSENNAERYLYDFWKLNPITKERFRITNFQNINFYITGLYDWDAKGEEVYFSGHYGKTSFKDNIYKFNISTKQLNPIVVSSWNDSNPSLSPDNTKIAFISDRTGDDELWIYNILNSKYTQVTGETYYQFDTRYTTIKWLNNNQLLITIIKGENSEVVTVSIN